MESVNHGYCDFLSTFYVRCKVVLHAFWEQKDVKGRMQTENVKSRNKLLMTLWWRLKITVQIWLHWTQSVPVTVLLWKTNFYKCLMWNFASPLPTLVCIISLLYLQSVTSRIFTRFVIKTKSHKFTQKTNRRTCLDLG